MILNDALQLDEQDPLSTFRSRFFIPRDNEGNEVVYLTGNSLGLQPRSVRLRIEQELDDWATLGVEGHFHAKTPWLPYHEFLTGSLARLVGCKPTETVAMNSLTVNLHLLMVSFYRPTAKRCKIMIERGAFPSDRYAVVSQLKFHGHDESALVELTPREGESTLRTEDIVERINLEGESLALILIGGVNYYTGQAFDMRAITAAGHAVGATVGFDLAHAAGNIELSLHDWDVDFAAWCSYKYLNAGPGAIAGVYVHERHGEDDSLPRFTGWWGHDKATRFEMGPNFKPIAGAEGWQLSNPPIFQLAALRASLEIFDEAGMSALRQRSEKLTAAMERAISELDDKRITVITPSDPAQRGCQLSIRIKDADKTLFGAVAASGVSADWREPDVMRIAPVPLYNSFEDVVRFADKLKQCLR
jgi:kynureninase